MCLVTMEYYIKGRTVIKFLSFNPQAAFQSRPMNNTLSAPENLCSKSPPHNLPTYPLYQQPVPLST